MQPFFRDVVLPSHAQEFRAHARFQQLEAPAAKPKRRPWLRVSFAKRPTS